MLHFSNFRNVFKNEIERIKIFNSWRGVKAKLKDFRINGHADIFNKRGYGRAQKRQRTRNSSLASNIEDLPRCTATTCFRISCETGGYCRQCITESTNIQTDIASANIRSFVIYFIRICFTFDKYSISVQM